MYHVWCQNAARPLTQTLQCSNPGSGPHGDVPWFSQFTQKQRLQKPMLCQQPTREIHLTRWVTQRFRCDLKGDVESWALGHILNARAVVGEIHLPQCSDTRLSLGHSSEQFTHFIFAFYQFWYFSDTQKEIPTGWCRLFLVRARCLTGSYSDQPYMDHKGLSFPLTRIYQIQTLNIQQSSCPAASL